MMGFIQVLLKAIKELESGLDRILTKVEAVKQAILDAIEAFQKLKDLMDGNDAENAERAKRIQEVTAQISEETAELTNVLTKEGE